MFICIKHLYLGQNPICWSLFEVSNVSWILVTSLYWHFSTVLNATIWCIWQLWEAFYVLPEVSFSVEDKIHQAITSFHNVDSEIKWFWKIVVKMLFNSMFANNIKYLLFLLRLFMSDLSFVFNNVIYIN